MTAHLFLLIMITAFAILAVAAKDLLISGIALGAASVALTLAMFEMNAPIAAVFELSVCAGLITVLFVSAVSLIRKEEHFLKEDRLRFYALPLFMGIFALAFWLFSEPLLRVLVPAVPTEVLPAGQQLWMKRWFDIAGQLAIFIAGVLAINVFFKSRKG